MAPPVAHAGIALNARHTHSTDEAPPREAMRVNEQENSVPEDQREVLDGLPVLIFLERAGTVVFANAEARRLLGVAEDEWAERPVEDVLWGLFPGTAEPRTRLTGSDRGNPFHATLPATNGRLVSIEGTYSILNAELRQAVIVAHTTDREPAPRSRLMEDVLASLPEAVAIEHQNHLLYINPAFTTMFGYTADEASGGSLRELIVPETRLTENAALMKAVDESGVTTVETVRKAKSGDFVDVSLQIAPLLVDNARVGYVFTYRDIGEHKQTEEKLQHDAMHDVLTGLPNRALFLDRLSLTLSRRMRRPDYGCGVLFMDLDHFKEINDGLGHAAGDALLAAAAQRLVASLRPQDSAARLGGDEFAVLVENILTAYDLEIVAGRILRELERPFDIFGHVVHAGASIGAAMAGPDHLTGDMLVRDADLAMYRAKQTGGSRYEIFDKHLEVAVTSQQAREREFRTALDKRRFAYQYQPIYRLANGKLDGFETIVCLRREDGSLDCVDDLLSVAEDTGLGVILGRQTLDAVCRQIRGWSENVPHLDLTFTLNIAKRQLFHPDLITHLKKALAASGADPSRLLIEAPENAFNENPDAAVAVLQRLADCRVRVAIDDFGSELAPLNHLVHLPIAMVKLAPRYSAAAVASGRQQAVLEGIIRLGNSLGIEIVAQGIENQEQLATLARMGCIFGQGPLFSPAMDAAQALAAAEKGYWSIASGTMLWS
jgi:diguanylate cyclase (GGDEF)-like protein/PAS domain S-box-containing protein